MYSNPSAYAPSSYNNVPLFEGANVEPQQQPMGMQPMGMQPMGGFQMQSLPVATLAPVSYAQALPMSGGLPQQPIYAVPNDGGDGLRSFDQATEANSVNSDGPAMVLVEKSSKHALKFKHFHDLKLGKPVVAEFMGSHAGQGLGRRFSEQKKYGQWRYTYSALGNAVPITIKLEDGFLVVMDTRASKRELCFDVSFWKYEAGNPVNFVGGSSESLTKQKGGGRSWVVNNDGTISCQAAPHLVLGVGVEIDAKDLNGCWQCSCFPCGCATFSITATSNDNYDECGIFLWFFVIPLIYRKKRRRTTKGVNTFINTADRSDNARFLSDKKINPGPYCLYG
eukprot:CAMPEP_0118653150 /NCGR_PEP_ID=MMETSP0785-20121206/11684_1 /TAXON_ID=91992 /ORGANISM="Bolidomonas pacifica, Strain CCMP 1866" /LENGTH=336 /DNA_ID=CAMNT_0006545687 /DNA_START=1142 /DNA_END=2149 /DNA_ORIENTATION=+